MSQLSSGLYPPAFGVVPTITTWNGIVFIANGRDYPQVIYPWDTTRSFDVGHQAPTGLGITSGITGGNGETTDQTFDVRIRYYQPELGFAGVSNPSSGYTCETTTSRNAIVINAVPEPKYRGLKSTKIIIEGTRARGQGDYFIMGISGMPVSSTNWCMPLLRQTEGILRIGTNLGHTPPDYYLGRVIFQFRNRLWSTDYEDETYGTAAVLSSNARVVSGVNTRWGPFCSGWNITFPGSGISRQIESVVGTSGLTLVSGFPGATAQGEYRIFPPDLTLVRYSEQSDPESWNIDGNYLRVPVNQGDRVKGFFDYFDHALGIVAGNSIFTMTYQQDPAIYKLERVSNTRGCINHECIVNANNDVYAMDYNGFWVFSSASLRHISNPIDNILFGREREWSGIDWTKSRYFRGVHNEREKYVRWYVALNRAGEAGTNNRSLSYYYQDDVWTMENWGGLSVMCATNLPDSNGNQQEVVSTSGYTLWYVGENTTDGAKETHALSGTISTGSSTTTLIVSASGNLYTDNDGLAGCAVVVSGVGSGIIDSNLVSTIYLRDALPATPVVGGPFWIAPIQTRLLTGARFIDPEREKHIGRYLKIRFRPTQNAYSIRVRFYFDDSTSASVVDVNTGNDFYDVDVSKAGGFAKLAIPKTQFNVMRVGLESLTPGNNFEVEQMWIDGSSFDQNIYW